jgi:hippurate hydrolase
MIHTAMLAGAACIYARQQAELAGEVNSMFQPEDYHGARFMLDDGLIDPLPDAAFALHIMQMPVRRCWDGLEH